MSDQTQATVAPSEQRAAVREQYADVATGEATDCCGTDGAGAACCDAETADGPDAESVATELGYDQSDLAAVPEDANMGLGCGNPTAMADLSRGETVLDLGSGGGFDCFLAAEAVGPAGRVVGVDMTPEMLETARANAEESEFDTVEFRLGEIEHLPVGDERVDVVISNCVVNLSPAKGQVFREAHRVLEPGGRIAISDMVRVAELPDDLDADLDAIAGCVGGAAPVEGVERLLKEAGFADVRVEVKADQGFLEAWDSEYDLSQYVASARIQARKPDTGSA